LKVEDDAVFSMFPEPAHTGRTSVKTNGSATIKFFVPTDKTQVNESDNVGADNLYYLRAKDIIKGFIFKDKNYLFSVWVKVDGTCATEDYSAASATIRIPGRSQPIKFHTS